MRYCVGNLHGVECHHRSALRLRPGQLPLLNSQDSSSLDPLRGAAVCCLLPRRVVPVGRLQQKRRLAGRCPANGSVMFLRLHVHVRLTRLLRALRRAILGARRPDPTGPLRTVRVRHRVHFLLLLERRLRQHDAISGVPRRMRRGRRVKRRVHVIHGPERDDALRQGDI